MVHRRWLLSMYRSWECIHVHVCYALCINPKVILPPRMRMLSRRLSNQSTPKSTGSLMTEPADVLACCRQLCLCIPRCTLL